MEQVVELAFQVLDAIYRAAQSSDHWPHALDLLTDGLGARGVALVGAVRARAWSDTVNVRSAGVTDAFREAWAAGFVDRDARLRASLAAPPGAVVSDADVEAITDIATDASYQQLYIPHDYPYFATIALRREAAEAGGPVTTLNLTVLRSGAQGRFTKAELATFRAFAQHVQAALELGFRAQIDAATLAALRTAFDRGPNPSFLLDAGGGVVAANSAAASADLLSGNVVIRRGRITFSDRRLQTRLGQALKLCEADPAAQVHLHGEDHADGGEVDALVASVRSGAASAPEALATHMPGGPVAMLTFYIGRHAHPGRTQAWIRRFKLTPAEAKVAEALCAGQKSQQISRHRGVSINTIRVQIGALFRKLDVANRTQAVTRLLSVNLDHDEFARN